MIVLKGKEEVCFSAEELDALVGDYENVCIDLGTGDGRNVYRKAKAEPQTLFIGVDPVKDNMLEIAVKLRKKPAKGGLPNVLLVLATAERLPEELANRADFVTVLFPWGTLLEGVVKPVEEILSAIQHIAKEDGAFEFITTYSDRCEENTIASRGLPPLSLAYFGGAYTEKLAAMGFFVEFTELLGNDYVKGFDSLWAKRLAFGRKRDFYRITGKIGKRNG